MCHTTQLWLQCSSQQILVKVYAGFIILLQREDLLMRIDTTVGTNSPPWIYLKGKLRPVTFSSQASFYTRSCFRNFILPRGCLSTTLLHGLSAEWGISFVTARSRRDPEPWFSDWAFDPRTIQISTMWNGDSKRVPTQQVINPKPPQGFIKRI